MPINGPHEYMSVDLAFETAELRKVFASSLCAKRAYGRDIAMRLRRLIADLQACEYLSDLDPQPIQRGVAFFIVVDANLSIEFVPQNSPPMATKKTDLSLCHRILIKGIKAHEH